MFFKFSISSSKKGVYSLLRAVSWECNSDVLFARESKIFLRA